MIFTENQQIIRFSDQDTFIYTQVIVLSQIFKFKKRKKHYLKLKLGHSKILRIVVPRHILFKTFRYRLILFGKKAILFRFLKELQQLRPPSSYTSQGLRIKPSRYRIKPGKIRRN